MDVCANRYGVASLSVGDASGVGWGAKYERAKTDVGSGMRAAQGARLCVRWGGCTVGWMWSGWERRAVCEQRQEGVQGVWG